MRTWLPESVGRAIMRTVLFETTVVSSPCWDVPHAAYHPPPLSRAQASELMNRPTPTVRANAIANGSRQTVLIDRFMLFLLCCACMKPEARARIHSTFLSTHACLSLMTTKRKGRKFLRPFFSFEIASMLRQCSSLASDTGAGANGTPPGPLLKLSGEIAGCCPTPGLSQSHTPSGK